MPTSYAIVPDYTPLGKRLQERTEQLQPEAVDALYGYAHGHLSEAMMRGLEQLATMVDPPDPAVPWQPLFDIDLCPDWALPWLAQCVGVRLPQSVTSDQARQLIVGLGFQKRGTTAAIAAAGDPLLRPGVPHTVYFRERDGGDPYRLEIVVTDNALPESDLPLTNGVTNPRPASAMNWWGGAPPDAPAYSYHASTTSKTQGSIKLAGAVTAQRWARILPTQTSLVVAEGDNVAMLISGRAFLGSISMRPVLLWLNGAGNEIDRKLGNAVPVGDAWKEVNLSGTVPTGAVGAAPAIEFNCAVGNIELYAAAALVGKVNEGRVPEYGDGTLADWDWTGAVDNSTSVRIPTNSVERAYASQVPAGIVFAYRTVAGWDYQAMTDKGGTYAEQSGDYADYRRLSENVEE